MPNKKTETMSKPRKSDITSVQRNPTLWLLKHQVNDERFLQIFADFAKLIRRSEKTVKGASRRDNPDYADFVADTESEYLEEIIGASFLMLQAIHATERDGKWWLTMNATKDGLKSAAGFKFDKVKATWVPA
jgi:hypothetical protein